ncbi:MAG: hypothetical protein QOJ98_1439 [Acidobacteriota bacterium]|jgi:hypothetical protein|nr:hypothetical protein [Acidobacteriota bacterium]
MTEQHFDAEITRTPRLAGNLESIAAAADQAVWTSAANALHERVYRTESGTVGVRVDWKAVNSEEPSLRVPLVVIDQRERPEARDLPAFIELFFHEAFLLFNIAVPGSFSGVIAPSGGELRINELALDARVFEQAWAASLRGRTKRIEMLPLAEVVAWYDSLGIGIGQIAANPTTKVLFHLLHLARVPEGDPISIVRLAQSLEALGLTSETLFALRDAICDGSAPVIHPMFDDALDGRLEDESFDWTEAADGAAALIISAIQQRVRER